jgi:hypothetical protein
MSRDWTPEDWHAHCRGYGRRAKGPRKNQRHHPSDVQDFIDFGGMRQIEYLAAAMLPIRPNGSSASAGYLG